MRILFAFVIAMMAITSLEAQNLSNKGKEFWVGYGHHQFMEPGQDNSQEMVLYFSAEKEAKVKVSINGTSYVRNYTVPANSVIATETIPKNGANDCRLYSVPPSFGGTGGEGVFNRGIQISSDVPIVAYAHIYGSLSSGATMLMPVETWGYSYATINSQQNYGNNNCFSWVFVVANEDKTVVEIIPSVRTRNGRAANVPFTVTLNKGQIYQVVGAALTSSTGYELTGTKVKSVANAEGKCFPIGVFAGSSRTAISCTGGSGSGDNILQQIFPFQAWGKKYLTTPTSTSASASSFNTNIYRVAVKDPSAVVKRNGQVLTGIKNNFYYEFTSNTPDYIESDKPILVAQYIPSSTGCPGVSGLGDPEMMYISPVEQSIKRIAFYRNKEEAINVNYLTLVIPDGGLASLRIDGKTDFTYTLPHPRLAGYTIVIKRWNADKTQCVAQSDSAFSAITYGLGSVESYGYNAGTMINNLSAISSIHNVLDNTVPEHDFTCTSTPVEVSVLMAYQPSRLQWLVSEAGGVISPATDVNDPAPVPKASIMVNGVQYYKYTLPGTYKFTTTGTFEIPILSTHPSVENCNNTERVTVQVVVREKPKVNFDFTHEGCARDTVYLSADGTSAGFSLVRWQWELPGNTTREGQKLAYLLPAGTQDVKLNVISSEGCVGDTIKQLNIAPHPVASFTASSAVCLDQEATLTDNSTIASGSIQSWNWNFGDGDSVKLANNDPVRHKYDAYRSFSASLFTISDQGCASDTFRQNIMVHPLPVPDFNLPSSVCMPEGEASFVNRSTLVNASGLTYVWDFGDGTPVSSAEHPTHIFTSKGSYIISLKATSAFGCSADTSKVLDAFFDQPLVDFSVNSDTLCQGKQSLFYDQSSSPGSPITSRNWVFGDGNNNQAANPAHTYRLPGKYQVKLTVTNSAGCVADLSKEVVVALQPVIDAGPSFVVPLGTQIRFNPRVNDSINLQFQWQPASDFANANVLRPTLMAIRNQSYTLTATGQANCTAEDSLTVRILKPVTAPNAFSPNGDGVNDNWFIQNIADYPGAVVEVFNRYGQLVFRSAGNFKSWDGKVQGKYLPVATYYYVITLKNGYAPLTGSITIVK